MKTTGLNEEKKLRDMKVIFLVKVGSFHQILKCWAKVILRPKIWAFLQISLKNFEMVYQTNIFLTTNKTNPKPQLNYEDVERKERPIAHFLGVQDKPQTLNAKTSKYIVGCSDRSIIGFSVISYHIYMTKTKPHGRMAECSYISLVQWEDKCM